MLDHRDFVSDHDESAEDDRYLDRFTVDVADLASPVLRDLVDQRVEEYARNDSDILYLRLGRLLHEHEHSDGGTLTDEEADDVRDVLRALRGQRNGGRSVLVPRTGKAGPHPWRNRLAAAKSAGRSTPNADLLRDYQATIRGAFGLEQTS